ncbi:MAG: YceI family protein [Pseudoxanthomonas sp.]
MRGRLPLLACLALCFTAFAPLAHASFKPLDQVQTRLGFELTTRWGQKLDGWFPRFEGGVEILPDGRHQVSLRMYTREVVIQDHPSYTKWARGGMFFESERYPVVTFTSTPYRPETLANGGELVGDLTIRGIRRHETLIVQPAGCARPALDCDVITTGAVRRSDYAMSGFKMAVNDRVVFVLRARLQGHATL